MKSPLLDRVVRRVDAFKATQFDPHELSGAHCHPYGQRRHNVMGIELETFTWLNSLSYGVSTRRLQMLYVH